jgi:hypothetical protein
MEKGFLRVLWFSTGNEHITSASLSLFINCGMSNLQLETAAPHKYSLAPTPIKEKFVIDN